MRHEASRARSAMQLSALAAAAAVCAGCASIPDVEVNYRPVRWALQVAIVHTVTCNRDNSLAIIERGATFVPIYAAAAADPRFALRLKDLDRFYADADLQIALTDDGRLKSINASTTGQGEAVIKGAITAAATLAAMPAPAAAPASAVSLQHHNALQKLIPKATPATVCRVVREWSRTAPDQLPQVSLVQTALVKGTTADKPPATSEDQKALLEQLQAANLDFAASLSSSFGTEELQPIAQPRDAVGSAEVPLRLQRMVSFSVQVRDAQGDIAAKSIPVPTSGSFVLPVPKAALFGKQSFSLSLADSGRITSLGYGSTSGAAGSLNALSAVAGAETTEENAQAAAMKAASDLIAQQQRFSNCKLKPTECK